MDTKIKNSVTIAIVKDKIVVNDKQFYLVLNNIGNIEVTKEEYESYNTNTMVTVIKSEKINVDSNEVIEIKYSLLKK